jgi:imidazolonepropionase-like amidohydrolase
MVPPWHHQYAAEPESGYAYRCLRKASDNLRAGVTSARTMMDRFNADLHLKAAIEAGIAEGPRLFVAGDAGWSRRAAGVERFRQHARDLLNAGVDHIKIFATGGIAHKAETIGHSLCSFEELKAAIDEAHRWRKHACVHATGDEGVIWACEAGADSIEHGFVMSEAGVEAIKKAGAVYSPQLTVTAAWNEDFMRGACCFPEWMIGNATEACASHHAMFRKAVNAGIKMVAGVDNLPRASASRVGIETFEGKPAIVAEIRHLAENGLTPFLALQAATINPAELCGAGGRLGTLEPGKLADLIHVDGDPLSDLNALYDVRLVMKSGRVVSGV